MKSARTRPATPRAARSERGGRTLAEIHRAARSIIGEHGSAAASQEQIAKRAGISQSTLRHHYPTKDELVDAIYDAAFEGYRESFERLLLEPGLAPADRLRRLLEVHLDHIGRTDDAYTFESFAHLARNAAARKKRDAWYGWLVDHYAALVRQIRPSLRGAEADAVAAQILTLMLGAWVTLGRSRPPLPAGDAAAMRAALLAGVEALMTGAVATGGR